MLTDNSVDDKRLRIGEEVVVVSNGLKIWGFYQGREDGSIFLQHRYGDKLAYPYPINELTDIYRFREYVTIY